MQRVGEQSKILAKSTILAKRAPHVVKIRGPSKWSFVDNEENLQFPWFGSSSDSEVVAESYYKYSRIWPTFVNKNIKYHSACVEI